MPTLQRPDVLAAIYQATSQLISRGALPSRLVHHGHSIFRSVDARYLPKPHSGGHVSRRQANQALMPRDGQASGGLNRFSGPSGSASIPSAGGLYCVLQQQALVNELMHYTKKPGSTALADKCVLKIRLNSSINCVELSPHNPGLDRFLNDLLNSLGIRALLSKPGVRVDLWKEITDGDDCSVARGIGLAVANSPFDGLIAETVRRSERSIAERGDNLILFGAAMKEIPVLWVEQALYFDNGANSLEIFPVNFP